MIDIVHIPCPCCSEPIETEVLLLISGLEIKCNNENCDAKIALGKQSKKIVEDTYSAFKKIK